MLAQYHLAASAERCSVDSASALSYPLEAGGRGVPAEHREGFRGSNKRYFIKIGSYLSQNTQYIHHQDQLNV
jgi:hypothetical protein